MNKEKKSAHQHEHNHPEEVHNHPHQHDEVSHKHPHFHDKLSHVHPHKHPPDIMHVKEEHLHEHKEPHYHSHTYSFERYSHLVSPIHQLDPRVKILAFFALVMVIVLTPPTEYIKFALYLTIIAIMVFISKVPWFFILKRSMVVVPFVLLVAVFAPFVPSNTISGSVNLGRLMLNTQGLLIFWNVLIKSWLSVLTIILLSCSTKFHLILKGFTRLRVPSILIMLLSFLYRFAFVFGNELSRTLRGYQARSFGNKYSLKVLGNALGSLFVRSYERGERIYNAMVSRGFEGEVKTIDRIKLGSRDLLFFLSFLLVLGLIYLRRF